MLAEVGETETMTPTGGGGEVVEEEVEPQEARAMAATKTSRNKKMRRAAEDMIRIVSGGGNEGATGLRDRNGAREGGMAGGELKTRPYTKRIRRGRSGDRWSQVPIGVTTGPAGEEGEKPKEPAGCRCYKGVGEMESPAEGRGLLKSKCERRVEVEGSKNGRSVVLAGQAEPAAYSGAEIPTGVRVPTDAGAQIFGVRN
jgi:hypothetical protein